MPTSQHRWPLWPWLVLTVAGVTITAGAAIVGAATSSDGGSAVPVTTRITVTATQFVTATVTATVTVSPPPAGGPAAELTDGLHEVGVDVLPGRYETAGPSGTNTGGCYWTRSSKGGGIIDNGVVRGPGTLTVLANELVETTGCQPWRLVG